MGIVWLPILSAPFMLASAAASRMVSRRFSNRVVSSAVGAATGVASLWISIFSAILLVFGTDHDRTAYETNAAWVLLLTPLMAIWSAWIGWRSPEENR